MAILEFEKPIYQIEEKIQELRDLGEKNSAGISPEIKRLHKKLEQLKKEIYGKLTVWQRIQVARHPDRPYMLDYVRAMMTDFVELHGDRQFADDFAMLAGFAMFEGEKVMVIGQQKGRDTNENIKRNFGCAHPEGYRKAMRMMRLAEKFHVPILVFVDTPGAYPGVGAEERGQAQAIAENLRDMMLIKTPIIATVIGEGGSGGALGIGVADRVFILQHAYYSVISPEGCASILWRNAVKAPDAAEALKLMGEDLVKFKVIDGIIPEPSGGAHRDPELVCSGMRKSFLENLAALKALSTQDLLDKRYQRFRQIGEFIE
ncbi:MAG: acetyl-CoA carboxylase carboxyltransferase subunit alpha [Candidatus Omnitrophica bacterium]|nr:acetyl-CoA carboxylase carboxyltransferase subunit alpha [Candidatus Omnitrophota bacterium]